jgi:hypothetical protein
MVFAGCLIGCNRTTTEKKSEAGAKKPEDEIKQAFTDLQAAIKARDVEKIWDLIDKDTRDDTENKAKRIKEAYGKLANKDKADFEKKFAPLTSKEIAECSGKLYVKSPAFYLGETDEMPDSKFEKVEVKGETAMLHYREKEGKGGKEERKVVRENGQWKFRLPLDDPPVK